MLYLGHTEMSATGIEVNESMRKIKVSNCIEILYFKKKKYIFK